MIVNLTGNNGGSGVDRQQVLDIVANSGFITEERDELFQNAPAAVITSGDISSWNLKANTEYVNMSDDMVLLSIAAQQVKDELFLASKSDIPDTSNLATKDEIPTISNYYSFDNDVIITTSDNISSGTGLQIHDSGSDNTMLNGNLTLTGTLKSDGTAVGLLTLSDAQMLGDYVVLSNGSQLQSGDINKAGIQLQSNNVKIGATGVVGVYSNGFYYNDNPVCTIWSGTQDEYDSLDDEHKNNSNIIHLIKK